VSTGGAPQRGARRPPSRGEPAHPDERDGADGERDESRLERLDRNTVELLNELRVAGTGIQVLFAFLLVVPFNTGFGRFSATDRYIYFATLLCITVAATLLIAPSIHHRILFRQAQKPYIVRVGNQFMIAAMMFLAFGFTGILIVITDVLFGGESAAIVGLLAVAGIGALWFALPLNRRRHEHPPRRLSGPSHG
jgi:hypothetical protein